MNRKSTLNRVFAYLKPYRFYLFLSLLLALITVGLTLLIPILTGYAIDEIVGAGAVNFPAVIRILIYILLSVGVTAVCQWIMSVCNNRLSFCVVRDIRRDAFGRIEKLPLKYLDSHPVGIWSAA